MVKRQQCHWCYQPSHTLTCILQSAQCPHEMQGSTALRQTKSWCEWTMLFTPASLVIFIRHTISTLQSFLVTLETKKQTKKKKC